jgi:hypothetical protein
MPGQKTCTIHKPGEVIIDEQPFLSLPTPDVLREIETDAFDYLTYKNLGQSPCACCGRLYPMVGSSVEMKKYDGLPLNSNLTLLHASSITYKDVLSGTNNTAFLYARKPEYNGAILDHDGIDEDGCVSLCDDCYTSLSKEKMPSFALANGQYAGPTPPELTNLTFAERHVIARVRSNNPIIKLTTGISQRALAGHFLFRMQNPKDLLTKLPIGLEDAASQIQIVLVKSADACARCRANAVRDPTCACSDVRRLLNEYKSILRIRPDVVRNAINWLVVNNPAWRDDVVIDEVALQSYRDDGDSNGMALYRRLGETVERKLGISPKSWLQQSRPTLP